MALMDVMAVIDSSKWYFRRWEKKRRGENVSSLYVMCFKWPEYLTKIPLSKRKDKINDKKKKKK